MQCPSSARCRPPRRATALVMFPRSAPPSTSTCRCRSRALAEIVPAKHRPGRQVDLGRPLRKRAHDSQASSCRSRPSAPRRRSGGADDLLRLHRQEVAVEHRRRLHERSESVTGISTGNPPAWYTPRFTSSTRLREVHVAVVEVRPGVEDRDDRLAHVVGRAVTHLHDARAVAEGAEVVRARTSGRSAARRGSSCGCGRPWGPSSDRRQQRLAREVRGQVVQHQLRHGGARLEGATRMVRVDGDVGERDQLGVRPLLVPVDVEPGAADRPAFNAARSAGSSTTLPRAMLTSQPCGPSASSTVAPIRLRVAIPPGQVSMSTSARRASSIKIRHVVEGHVVRFDGTIGCLRWTAFSPLRRQARGRFWWPRH